MKLIVVTKPDCPYCEALRQELSHFRPRPGVEIAFLRDGRGEAQQLDYYYLPAVFWKGERILHGNVIVRPEVAEHGKADRPLEEVFRGALCRMDE